MNLSNSKEDYLKALYHLSKRDADGKAGINQLAEYLGLSAASINNMLKKLRADDLVAYEKYGKVELTDNGRTYALKLVRKHRIWETFLYSKLNFKWDEVHDVAEQLEHIDSEKLIDRIDALLGHPAVDPHGEPIPAADGSLSPTSRIRLSELETGAACRLVSVNDSSAEFLQYVTAIGLELNKDFQLTDRQSYDNSFTLTIDGKEVRVSEKFAENVFVEKA